MTEIMNLPLKGEYLSGVPFALSMKTPTRSDLSSSDTSRIKRRFEAAAREVGINSRGLQGAKLYRDSQFELLSRDSRLTKSELQIARAAFNRAFDERIVLRFPGTHAAVQARRRLQDAAA